MNNFSKNQVIWQENSLRCRTWSLSLSNLFNSHFPVVSLLFVLGPSIHFICGWFIQSLWPLKLCLLLSQQENSLLFIWKQMSAQLSSCSLRCRCSPCASVFCGLSVNANDGDLDRCTTGKAGSLNVMVSFPPETIDALEPFVHQLHTLSTNGIQTYPTLFLQCFWKVQNRKSISNDPLTAWKKKYSALELEYASQIWKRCMFLPAVLSKGQIMKEDQLLYANCISTEHSIQNNNNQIIPKDLQRVMGHLHAITSKRSALTPYSLLLCLPM